MKRISSKTKEKKTPILPLVYSGIGFAVMVGVYLLGILLLYFLPIRSIDDYIFVKSVCDHCHDAALGSFFAANIVALIAYLSLREE